MYGIDPETVDVELPDPVHCGGYEEGLDFRSAVVECQRPPLLLLCNPLVRMLISRRPVEEPQAVGILAEMRRYEVHALPLPCRKVYFIKNCHYKESAVATTPGVTHIQLMPVNDFITVDELNRDKSYNWGYDPHFFMVPEGSYATDPNDPKKLHDNEKLVPGYYFRHNQDLSLSRRATVFDLMGALDIETMQGIESIVQKQDREIFLLGEGWDPIIPLFQRDPIKGSNFEFSEKGYVNGDGRGIEHQLC